MIADQRGHFGVREVDVNMQGADREILEHPAVLLDAGTVARMVPDCAGCAAVDDRRARRVDLQPFGRRRGGRGASQPNSCSLSCVASAHGGVFTSIWYWVNSPQTRSPKVSLARRATRAPAGSGIRV